MADADIPSSSTLDELQDIPTLPELLTSNSSVPLSTFTDPEISEYLVHLTTLPLESLQSEPTSLSSSSAQLTNALTTASRLSSPEPDDVCTCCCGREECETSRAWAALRAKLESRLVLSAGTSVARPEEWRGLNEGYGGS